MHKKMKLRKGRWWDGGRIEYSDNNCIVRIRSGMWWVGLAMLISLSLMAMNPEIWEHLSLWNPWHSILIIGVLFFLFAISFMLVQWSTFYADRSNGTYRLSWKWLGIPIRKQSGNLSEIDYVIIKEHVLEFSDQGGSYLHLYIKARDHELYLFQLTSRLNEMEVRRLALFLGRPLMFTDKGLLREGTYERLESLEEIQSHLSTSQSHNEPLKKDQKR